MQMQRCQAPFSERLNPVPELPEVEVTRRSFADRIRGATIRQVQLGKPLRWPLGVDPDDLQGRVVQEVRRRGKYLLMDLDQGLLMLHLGMSGSLRFDSRLPPAGPHDHFEMNTTQGVLRLNDPRRFGAIMHMEGEHDARARKLLDHLGVEPLEEQFTLQHLADGLRRRKAPVKQALLAGDIVVGVGNIYCSVALFRAGIDPLLPACALKPAQVRRLWEAIRYIIQWAIDEGGSTLKDFSSAEGRNGYFQLQAMVYDRAGQPCRVCGTPIRMLRQGQRSTYVCAKCQKMPRSRFPKT